MSGRTMAINTKDEIVQNINYLEYYKAELGQLLKTVLMDDFSLETP